jgi:hypothetical protein
VAVVAVAVATTLLVKASVIYREAVVEVEQHLALVVRQVARVHLVELLVEQ